MNGRLSTNEFACVFALFALALAWRIPWSATLPMTWVDEVLYSWPTVEQIKQGHLLTYVYGTNYAAPVHEYCAAWLSHLFGNSLLVFRCPVGFFSSAAVAVSFLLLSRLVGLGAAAVIGLVLACPSSAPAIYQVLAVPAYAATMLLVALMQWATLALDRERTPPRWILFGALAGVAFYVFKLSLMQSAVSFGWLFSRSALGRQMIERFLEDRTRAARDLTVLLGSAILMAPVLYRALTRRGSYTPQSWELALVGLALLIVAVGLWRMRRCLPDQPTGWQNGVLCGIAFLAAALPPMFYYSAIEQPRLAAEGVNLYTETAYSWKHAHEWPFQLRLFFDRVFPSLWIGRVQELEGFPTSVPVTWKSLVSAGIGVVLLAGAWHRATRSNWRLALPVGTIVLIGPFVLTSAVMLPSWLLHGEFCYRYLLPYMSGFLLLAYLCCEQWITAFPRFAVAVGLLYVTYCGADCLLHLWT
jgi:hypothetical protein